MIGHEARAPEAARTAHLVQVFGPFWIQLPIRFFVLRLEYADSFLRRERRGEGRGEGGKH